MYIDLQCATRVITTIAHLAFFSGLRLVEISGVLVQFDAVFYLTLHHYLTSDSRQHCTPLECPAFPLISLQMQIPVKAKAQPL